jgi:DNA adenine methylase
MQYLGGKSRLAKAIAAVVAPRGLWWEPFCGGLSVSVQLAKYGPGIVSDVNPALMALYQAVRDGWQPPTSVSREQYDAAKRLPDSDPMKAFCGFGLSFGAKWFAGADVAPRDIFPRGLRATRDPVRGAREALLRDLPALSARELRCASFFSIMPGSLSLDAIYCDPPYAGTTDYAAVAPIDHAAFWARCREWARYTRVFVSEYSSARTGCDLVWSCQHSTQARGGNVKDRVERLWRVYPREQLQLAI